MDKYGIDMHQTYSKALRLRDLAVTLGRCRQKYLEVKQGKIKEPYQMPPSEMEVATELSHNKEFSEQIDGTLKQLKSAWEYRGYDLKKREQVFQLVKENMPDNNIRDDYCLAKYAQCAAALYMAVNLEEEWTEEDIIKFSAIEMIVRSMADRTIGYWTCMIHQIQDSFKAKGKAKSNSPKKPIQEALKIFLREKENNDLLNKENEKTKNRFLKKITSTNEIFVVIEQVKYEVYCDGGYIYTSNVKENKHLKRIKAKTLLKPEYISLAKKDILSEMNH